MKTLQKKERRQTVQMSQLKLVNKNVFNLRLTCVVLQEHKTGCLFYVKVFVYDS